MRGTRATHSRTRRVLRTCARSAAETVPEQTSFAQYSSSFYLLSGLVNVYKTNTAGGGWRAADGATQSQLDRHYLLCNFAGGKIFFSEKFKQACQMPVVQSAAFRGRTGWMASPFLRLP